MTIEEKHYLFGKIPLPSQSTKIGDVIEIIETAPMPGFPGFEDLGRFAYGTSVTTLSLDDEETVNARSLPIKYSGYAEYADILGSFTSNDDISMRSFKREQINSLPKLPGRIPFTKRRLIWKAD